MIHEQDEYMIKVMVGAERITPAMEKEYEIRLRMYHRSGASGPLGVQGLIPMLRDLGAAPAEEKKEPTLDILQLKKGDPIVVVQPDDSLRSATYASGMRGGSHSVLYEGDDTQSEVYGWQMRPVPQAPEDMREATPEVDWSQVEAQSAVVAQIEVDGPPRPAKFIRVHGDNIKVMPDGEKKHYSVPPDQVALA